MCNHGRATMNKNRIVFSLLLLVVTAVLAAWLVNRLRGPVLPGYTLESRPLVQVVVATGRVISTSRAQVGSEVTGTVIERRVQEGDRVKPGDVLAVLRSDDLTANLRQAEAALRQLQRAARPQAQAALRQAEATLAQAARERQRRAELFTRQLIAREALEQAEEAEAIARAAVDQAQLAAQAVAAGGTEEQQQQERIAAARAQLAKTTIRAAIAGTVLTRNAEPGDLVQPSRVLFEIARDGVTEIEVPVDEKNLGVLAPGQEAQCIADAWPGRPFKATVNYLAPGVDATRGTVTVRLRVEPVPEFLRQDMTVSVNIETGRRETALLLPHDALLGVEDGAPAVLAVRDERLQRVPVTLGLRGLAASEVTAGLAAGEQVLAAAAAVALPPGARVRVDHAPLPETDAGTRRELPVQLD
jgi:HlyD family secretion protein